MNKSFASKKHFKLANFYSILVVLFCLNLPAIPFLPSGQSDQWSLPETIPLYHSETNPPTLIADQNRTVHAFSSQWISEEGRRVKAVVYNQWTLEQGWTKPTDILISPNKEARVTNVYLDRNGVFHLIFFGGDYTAAGIYYSKATANIAENPRAWSTPLLIGENASDPENAVIQGNDQGSLFVVYSGRQLGNGLYIVSSADDGKSWSDSRQIFLAQSSEPTISLLQMIKSKSGRLHAIWGVYNIDGQGRGIYYTSSKDGNQWREPTILVDSLDGLGTQTPTIIENKGTLYALFNLPPKITMRRSLDDGETWDAPSSLFPRHVGVNGSLSLVVDSNNDLHLFFGQRITGNPDIHGMWHSVLLHDHWIEPEGIVRGSKVFDLEGYNAFDPNTARAVVSQGNVLLVTWRTDPGSKGNGVWFSYKRIDSPELPVISLPTSQFNQAHESQNEDLSLVLATPTSEVIKNSLLESQPTVLTVGNIITLILVVVVLFLILFFISTLRKRSS